MWASSKCLKDFGLSQDVIRHMRKSLIEQGIRSVHRESYRPQGRPHSLKYIQPRKYGMNADGDVVKGTEANTERSGRASFLRVCRGHRTWHVWKEVTGTWEALMGPAIYYHINGR